MEKHTGQAADYNLFLENEWEANRYAARCIGIVSLVAILCWILDIVGIFITPKVIMNTAMPIFLAFSILPAFICRLDKAWVKYAVMCCSISGIFILSCAISKHMVVAWMLPLILSCHYYSKKLTRFVLILSVVLFSASIYIAMYFGEWDQTLLDMPYYSGERVITGRLLLENTLFFVLPRTLILIGAHAVCMTIAGRTRNLLEKQAKDNEERQRTAAELDVATRIQTSMLPCIFPAFPERQEFDIYASMTPAKEVGGDFYDFFLVDETRLAIVIADVSGKGVPAALFMMVAKNLLNNAAQAGLSPDKALEKVNNQLCENNDAEMFVTCFMGIADIKEGKLFFANAGHNPPLLRHNGGKFEFLKFKPGFVLGEFGNLHYRIGETDFVPGDEIFLYTDGVTEATNARQQMYGNERLLTVLNCSKGKAAKELCTDVKADVDGFVGDAPQFDDMTMLHLKLLFINSVTVAPTLESMAEVSAFVEDVLQKNHVPHKIIIKLNIAVDEIFSNIVRYSKAKSAEVACNVEESQVCLTFTDNGEPFEPTKKAAPDAAVIENSREEGGMGIYIVKNFMDAVEYVYEGGHNVLKLTKKL
ncbi:MAG: SpoIIE family protein phosphatase [Clostridiales bacterium]|nr:SpoIIE family protein phosphatase [Clostridiales bacterium]